MLGRGCDETGGVEVGRVWGGVFARGGVFDRWMERCVRDLVLFTRELVGDDRGRSGDGEVKGTGKGDAKDESEFAFVQ